MQALGFERFAVAGHDRGARVAHRLARDHAKRIERLALLDIVPTLYRFETVDQKAATSSWHWFFLIQPRGFPERLIGTEAEFFLRHQLGALLRDPAKLEPEAFAEYLRCFRNPETIRATCDEYRAGASIDLEHDRADRDRKLPMPLLVLWGERSAQGSGYDVLGVWRDHAENVSGHGIASGHFLPEEAPDETYQALRGFFAISSGIRPALRRGYIVRSAHRHGPTLARSTCPTRSVRDFSNCHPLVASDRATGRRRGNTNPPRYWLRGRRCARCSSP